MAGRTTKRAKSAVAVARESKGAPAAVELPDVPVGTEDLLPQQRAFVLEYLSNGHNGTRAYLAAYPECPSYNCASQQAFKSLRNGKIQAAIQAANGARWKRLIMDGDEALALISLSSRADINDAFDDDGKQLPVNQWPDALRLSVKAIKGNGDIVLHDGLRARELMAQAAGRIKNTVDVNHRFDHARYLTDEKDSE